MSEVHVFGSAIADDVARLLFEIGAIKDKSCSPGGEGFRLKLHDTKPDAPHFHRITSIYACFGRAREYFGEPPNC